MSSLHKRARAEEAVFANQQTAEFYARAAGLKRLGEWAAEHMMEKGSPAVAVYAEALVRSGVLGEDPLAVVHDSFRNHGVDVPVESVRSTFDAYVSEARLQHRV